jgi:hypothetical protein
MALKEMSIVMLLGLLLCTPVLTQEHAPLLATCEADVALWYSENEFTDYLNSESALMRDGTPNKTSLNLLSISEVIARHEEMGKCWSMTHREIFHQADNSYVGIYTGIYTDREHNFIVRHKLMDQFLSEDADGKR